VQQPESGAATSDAPLPLVPQHRLPDAFDGERFVAARSAPSQTNVSVTAAPIAATVRTIRANVGELEAAEDRFIAPAEEQRAKTRFVDASPLFAGFDAEQMVWDELKEMQEALDTAFTSPWTYGAIAGLGAISAGYLLWGLQAGSLVTSALASLPVWGSFDPLPVLEFWERDSKRKSHPKPDDEDPLLQPDSDLSLV
jgi:hypothetical protein